MFLQAQDTEVDMGKYAKARSAYAGSDLMARTIAVPKEHRPLRLPTYPNLERTAVAAFESTGTMSVRTDTTGEAPPGTVLMVRSPTYPLWGTFEWIAGSTTGIAVYQRLAATTGGDLSDLILTTFTTAGDIYYFPDEWTMEVNSSNAALPASRYPVCYYHGRQYVKASQVNNGFVTGVWWNWTGSGTINYQVKFEALVDGELKEFTGGVNGATGGGSDFLLNSLADNMDFVRPVSLEITSITGGPVLMTTFAMGITTGTSIAGPTAINGSTYRAFLPLFSPPELSTPTVYESVRATAVGALFSNVTAVLNKEGTVNAIRIPREGNSIWKFNSFSANVGKVQPKDRYFGPMEKGLYMFASPDSSTETFRDHVHAAKGTARFYLDGFDYANLVKFSDLDSTSGSTLALTLDVHLEFRTASMLFPTGFSTVSLESFHVANMALAKQGNFFENPVHLAAIAGMIKNAVATLGPLVAPHAKAAASAVGTYVLERSMKALSNRMSQASLQPSKPAPKPQAKKGKPVQGKKVRVQRK